MKRFVNFTPQERIDVEDLVCCSHESTWDLLYLLERLNVKLPSDLMDEVQLRRIAARYGVRRKPAKVAR